MTPRLIIKDGALVAGNTGVEETSIDPTSTTKLALTTEAVKLGDVDQVFASLAAAWRPSLELPSSDLDAATLWALLRTGQAHLIAVHNPKVYVAASAWRFERWAKDTVFRCVAHVGMHGNATQWLPDLIELAKATARAGGATRIIWEVAQSQPGEQTDALGFKALRRTLAMEV